ncbi:hypothetical protein ROLI_020410 [Roseobacter fucihabitans]|uniref:Phospholipid/glycerol acyltransferase domain-containing protein n=1 Tax=Roseobacter fucihabitans TaxID=1537242 RepID=A0ABZ2BUG3_9RHOB|nr:lysophospholipid acyltransferase family protein [Roseobacter litoralis]MBC6966544.1 2-acyl-glycerophospho-ethanolamine acyltransferase [Roseobacter litoralis]
MSITWQGGAPPPASKITWSGWILVALRGPALAFLLFGGFLVLLALRLFERPLFGQARPVTPFITVFVCRMALCIIGLRMQRVGQAMQAPGAIVANHASWLDIFVLNAGQPVYFVSKSEVARWPGIGWLARATGTVFIERSRSKASVQSDVLRGRLAAGHSLLFFPEGTSSDGLQVLRFKSALFDALFKNTLRDSQYVQPVSVTYDAPPGSDPRFYGWWGDMDLGPHLLKVLATRRGGYVRVIYATPLKISAFEDRKSLAMACETEVRSAHGARGAR